MKKENILFIITLFITGLFYGCDTYKKSLPRHFYAVMESPKFEKGEIMIFHFCLCESDTFTLSINGKQLYANYTPSKLSHYTNIDEHTTSGVIYNFDFVIYQLSRKRSVMYLINGPGLSFDVSFKIPLREQSLDISGSFSATDFKYSVPMGSCKHFRLHHSHKDSIVVNEDCLQGIRFYE